ncbi:hypothetical protein [Roseisolibacter agri]|uniref:Uncharacterized protein n=1 Tax=Roseisolibacter agri TaxID=2014610 RepID=A0AA37Q9X3_9BACT|nr:hypothetical protein [Roseisolibacter agri]GLC25041.1 hypothetical protein rosag_15540 [Roseisolibacter agri]
MRTSETDDKKVWASLAAPLTAPTTPPQSEDLRVRLDTVVAGEWDLTLDLLPKADDVRRDGRLEEKPYAFKARLQILGVIREGIGTGDDYAAAAEAAFRRAALHFGIGAAPVAQAVA